MSGAGLLKALKRALGLEWPEGEPLLTRDGFRWGTRLPGGTIIFAYGYRFDRLVCSRCQQAIEAEQSQAASDRIEKES